MLEGCIVASVGCVSRRLGALVSGDMMEMYQNWLTLISNIWDYTRVTWYLSDTLVGVTYW